MNFVQLLLILFFFFFSSTLQADLSLKNGDLLFQTSQSTQSKAIQLATHSSYSHVGIVLYKNNTPYILEAKSKVKWTTFEQWVAQGRNGDFLQMRPRKPLSKVEEKKLLQTADTFVGKKYDNVFEWSDDKMYCSELVWKIYEKALQIKLAKLQKLRDFDLKSKVVRKKLEQRYGNKIPLDEEVISPKTLIESSFLEKVVRR